MTDKGIIVQTGRQTDTHTHTHTHTHKHTHRVTGLLLDELEASEVSLFSGRLV